MSSKVSEIGIAGLLSYSFSLNEFPFCRSIIEGVFEAKVLEGILLLLLI